MTTKKKEVFYSTGDSEIYYTYDLGLSAALVCLGFRLLFLDKTNPNKARLTFKRTKRIETVADAYLADTLKVSARSYFDNLKALKNRLYSDL